MDKPKRLIQANPLAAGLAAGVASADRIEWIKLSRIVLPLAQPISDAKVLTGRQKPLTEVAFVFADIASRQGHAGLGFSYSKRAGGPGQYAHAKELAPNLIGEDPNDIARLWDKLVWAGASVGRSGLATQAIAAFDIALWDLKARRARLPLAKLLGAQRDTVACYNTSGGFLSSPIAQVLDNVEATLARHRRHQNQSRSARHVDRPGSRARRAPGHSWPRRADDRRQPAVGSRHGTALRPPGRATRTDLDRRTAGRLRRRRPCRVGRFA